MHIETWQLKWYSPVMIWSMICEASSGGQYIKLTITDCNQIQQAWKLPSFLLLICVIALSSCFCKKSWQYCFSEFGSRVPLKSTVVCLWFTSYLFGVFFFKFLFSGKYFCKVYILFYLEKNVVGFFWSKKFVFWQDVVSMWMSPHTKCFGCSICWKEVFISNST